MLRTLLLCFLLGAVLAKDKILVLQSSKAIQKSHAQYFQALTDQGFDLKYKSIDDNVDLESYGEYVYDSVIVFAPSADQMPKEALLKFLDERHNILMVASDSDAVKEWLEEVNIKVVEDEEEVNAKVVSIPSIVGASSGRTVAIKGLPLKLGALPAPETTYYPVLTGDSHVFIYSMQTRVDGRLTVLGSLDMFSDAVFQQDSKMMDLASELSMWTFGRRGVVRAVDFAYRRLPNPPPCSDVVPSLEAFAAVNETNPPVVSVNEFLRVSFRLEERVLGSKGEVSWIPFVRPGEVQVEFTMLDPRIRKTLDVDLSGVYSTQFRAPDVYGIYKFVVRYHAPGYNTVAVSQKLSVRPWRHNQFERFIPQAFPYYAAAFTSIAALFVFTCAFLCVKPSPKRD